MGLAYDCRDTTPNSSGSIGWYGMVWYDGAGEYLVDTVAVCCVRGWDGMLCVLWCTDIKDKSDETDTAGRGRCL